MREIKIRYRFRNRKTDERLTCVLKITEIEIQSFHPPVFKDWPSWEILSRDEWTGLEDKNGKEIYEEDIVRVRQPWNTNKPEIIAPVYCDGPTEWSWSDFGNIHKALTYDEDTEVIGNIYEHPELLEAKE